MKVVKNPSVWDLLICNYLGIHNRKRQSVTGAVHYCSRCGIVTRDNRLHWLAVADVKWAEKGIRVVFGAGGQEFVGSVKKIDYAANKIALSDVVALPKWRSKLARATAAVKRLVTLSWLKKGTA
jgi:hypothetical protein